MSIIIQSSNNQSESDLPMFSWDSIGGCVMPGYLDFYRKRPAKAVLTGATGYSAGRATRQGSSSPTRFTGQSAITFSTCRR